MKRKADVDGTKVDFLDELILHRDDIFSSQPFCATLNMSETDSSIRFVRTE